MTHVLNGLIPVNFGDWRMEVLKLPDRLVVTARRTGVTIMLVQVDGWWTITKMHKGQQIACKIVKELPKSVADTITLRKKEQDARPKLSVAAQKAKGTYGQRKRDSSLAIN